MSMHLHIITFFLLLTLLQTLALPSFVFYNFLLSRFYTFTFYNCPQGADHMMRNAVHCSLKHQNKIVPSSRINTWCSIDQVDIGKLLLGRRYGGKQFIVRFHLGKHLAVHTGITLYLCVMSFTSSDNDCGRLEVIVKYCNQFTLGKGCWWHSGVWELIRVKRIKWWW